MAGRVVREFWKELDQRYAVFPQRLRRGSWEALGRSACATVARDTSATTLFGALERMAQALDDGHIQISAPSLDRRTTGWANEYPHGELMAQLVGRVESRYAGGPLRRAGAGRIAWGRLGAVGYLDLAAFEGLGGDGREAASVAAVRAVMPEVVAAMAGVAGLIVDLRNNEGGYDAVGLEVARWFRGPRTFSYTKARRNGPHHDQVGPWDSVFVDASPSQALDGPTIVLVSGWTFSAAETFVLSMRTRAGVTILGEHTSGHLSDLFRAQLPNGWRYTFSGERYRAADGVIYEGRGIPLDVLVPFDTAAFRAGRDGMLEAALTRLGRR